MYNKLNQLMHELEEYGIEFNQINGGNEFVKSILKRAYLEGKLKAMNEAFQMKKL
jgi:hypothetical protein